MFLITPLVNIAPSVSVLDQSHRLCNDAIASAAVACDGEFSERLSFLISQMHDAFTTEERWMEGMDHGALQCHREQHARALGAMHHIHASVMQGNIGVGRRAVTELLPKWLAFHTETMDNVLALALRCDERRETHREPQPAPELA